MSNSEETSGAVSGAVKGAAAGAAIAGPVGAVVGAVIGAISGWLGGTSKSKARKAAETQQQIEKTRAALDRRNIILEGYVARARAVAAAGAQDDGGGLQSSAPLGAISSVGSQLEFNVQYFNTQANLLTKRNKYVRDSSKYAQYASNVSSIGSLISTGYSVYGLYNTPSTPSPGAGGSPGRGWGSAA
jgi:hypothetical protein